MTINKIPRIWEVIFIFGFVLSFIHLFSYFLSLSLGIISWHSWFLDYEYFSKSFLLIRIIFFITSLIMFFKRKENPILFNGLIWLQFWILISHQMDRYIFLAVPIIFCFSFINSFNRRFINKS